MDKMPFYKRPWFYITSWLVFLVVVYFWQIYSIGGIQANLYTVLQDLLCVFPLFFIIWLALFSQFILPVNKFTDRMRIFEYLIRFLFGKRDSTIFIENGVIREHAGERLKKGPSILWLDSASVAVTQKGRGSKQVLGPGVHFITEDEFIVNTLDLHLQFQLLGPQESENPFEEKNENQTQAEWSQIQYQRKLVSAFTRDGIEVVPNISIQFRVNTGFPRENELGSRFGYRTGFTKNAREKEKEDQKIILKAISDQEINIDNKLIPSYRKISWNELPATLAVDLWREYVAKFTLSELFTANQLITNPPTKLNKPNSQKLFIQNNKERGNILELCLTSILRMINMVMAGIIHSMDRTFYFLYEESSTPDPFTLKTQDKAGNSNMTVFEVINQMVLARLTQPRVMKLSSVGRSEQKELEVSKEYAILQERGLRVLSVSISNLRLIPELERQLINQWSANSLKNAKAESERIDRERAVIEESAKEEAFIKYAEEIGQEVNKIAKMKSPEVYNLLKALLLRSRMLIHSVKYGDELRSHTDSELKEIEKFIKFIGGG
jgi:hypothetical protein